jgi:hypothetical protein
MSGKEITQPYEKAQKLGPNLVADVKRMLL